MTAKKPVKKTVVKKPPKKVTKKVIKKEMTEAHKLAVLFHDTYERLAPKYGYETRKDTKKFKPTTPNGKLMIAVASEVLAKQTKQPIPEKVHEDWFFKLPSKYFIQLQKEWNEINLKITLKAYDNYDDWFNYFKTLSPNVIRLLATTGLDILPTEAYSALARWHDIIANPGRIDKVHQSGLTNPKGINHKSITELASQNDRLGVLMATRDKIAEKLDKGAGARDTAALTREMTDIMTQIADYERRQGPKKETKLGQLLGDMHTPPGKRTRAKGARATSFKGRVVTIEDVEAAT